MAEICRVDMSTQDASGPAPHDRRRDDYWMGQIAAKLDNLREMLESVKVDHAQRLIEMERRLSSLEGEHNRFVGKVTVLSALLGIIGAMVVNFIERRF